MSIPEIKVELKQRLSSNCIAQAINLGFDQVPGGDSLKVPRQPLPALTGSKDDLWTRLAFMRGLSAWIELQKRGNRGPAFDALIAKVFTNVRPTLPVDNEGDWDHLKKAIVTSEIASHIPDYAELPQYFGPELVANVRKCSWKCNQICMCQALSPPCAGWLSHTDLAKAADYKELQDAWASARTEWLQSQEHIKLVLAQELVERAPSINSMLPYDMVELIAKHLVQGNEKIIQDQFNAKKDLAMRMCAIDNEMRTRDLDVKQIKWKLARCGLAAKRAAKTSGVAVQFTPRIQKNHDRLTVEVREKENIRLAVYSKRIELVGCCKKSGVDWSQRMARWVLV